MIWHRLAEQDLTEAYLFIGGDSQSAAERLLDAVEVAVQLLCENAGVGREREFSSPRARSLRSWVVKRFPQYVIFYRATGDDLEIVRFIHGTRDVS